MALAIKGLSLRLNKGLIIETRSRLNICVRSQGQIEGQDRESNIGTG
jgi:hypothetical protein